MGCKRRDAHRDQRALGGRHRPDGRQELVCPGPVDTPFFEATGAEGLRGTIPKASMVTAEQVVRESLRALRAGRSFVVPGVAFKLAALGTKFMPRDLLAAMTARYMKR